MRRNSTYFLVLGSFKKFTPVLEQVVSLITSEVLLVSYGEIEVDNLKGLKVSLGHEVDEVKKYIGKSKIAGALTVTDEYVSLLAIFVDAFSLPGSSEKSVKNFKNKLNTIGLMKELGLGDYVPETRITSLDSLKKNIKNENLPIIVKPDVGSKSRGVYRINAGDNLDAVISQLENHFESQRYVRTSVGKRMVLLQRLVEGRQMSVTCFVDREGELQIIGFVEIYTGKDLGQHHQQLVFRTSDVMIDELVQDRVIEILKDLVRVSGIRSTLLHPEFIIENDKPYLIELNVRLGGFRNGLSQLAYGVNLHKICVDLALGKVVEINKKQSKSCTAVEWWSDKDGKIEKLKIPDSGNIKNLLLKVSLGDVYISPPIAQRPLASFFVVSDEGSLNIAKELLGRFKVVFR